MSDGVSLSSVSCLYFGLYYVQEVVAAQGRLVGELGRVEKVRGEVTDLLRSLDTALSGAQVTP